MVRAYIWDVHPGDLSRLSRLLEQSGKVTVVGSSSGQRLELAELGRLEPDVLFLDFSFPAAAGMAAVMQVLCGYPHLPLIFVTADKENGVWAFENNVFDYLIKPVEKWRLDKTLTRLAAYIQFHKG